MFTSGGRGQRRSPYCCHRWARWGMDGRLVCHGWPDMLFFTKLSGNRNPQLRELEHFLLVWGKISAVWQCLVLRDWKKNILHHIFLVPHCTGMSIVCLNSASPIPHPSTAAVTIISLFLALHHGVFFLIFLATFLIHSPCLSESL